MASGNLSISNNDRTANVGASTDTRQNNGHARIAHTVSNVFNGISRLVTQWGASGGLPALSETEQRRLQVAALQRQAALLVPSEDETAASRRNARSILLHAAQTLGDTDLERSITQGPTLGLDNLEATRETLSKYCPALGQAGSDPTVAASYETKVRQLQTTLLEAEPLAPAQLRPEYRQTLAKLEEFKDECVELQDKAFEDHEAGKLGEGDYLALSNHLLALYRLNEALLARCEGSRPTIFRSV